MNDNQLPLYIEETIAQANKKNNFTCGDYTQVRRSAMYTDYILCDGMGSGPKAHLSAVMCASRILELMHQDLTIYKAAEKAVQLMHRARKESVPFAAFTVVRIMRSGQYTSLSYEIPPPLLISKGIAQKPPLRHFPTSHEVVTETVGQLSKGDTLVLCSDGVTQAGLGHIQGLGWGIDGLCSYINKQLSRGESLNTIPTCVVQQSFTLSGRVYEDDTTLVVLRARTAKTLNLLTGPPAHKKDDSKFFQQFLAASGQKVVCGSTTAEIVARYLNKQVHPYKLSTTFNQPPSYTIEGIDVVSEGAVTLNQVYNILDEPPTSYNPDSCVSDIARLLRDADIVRLYVGTARNQGHDDIAFKQIGILQRSKIIDLLIEKLQSMEKIVIIHKA